MPDDLSALTLLGESADWLKDEHGISIREHRLAALEAYRAAWSAPAENARLTALQEAFGRLFEALRHNQLYPEAVILGRAGDKAVRYLPAAGTLRRDFELLRSFCVVNKFGIGEVHLLHVVLLLCRMLYQPQRAPYDKALEETVGEVLFLRAPVYRADNLSAFSSEAKARYHAVRIMHSMMKLGIFEGPAIGKISAEDQAEARELLTNDLRAEAAAYIQREHRHAFAVFDTASALEAFAHSHQAGQAPLDERTPEELFAQLRHRLRRLHEEPNMEADVQGRIMNLGIAAIVRAMTHADSALSHDMYVFLRSRKYKPTVRHARMFEVLPNNAERLRFLNFLYLRGKQNPVYYLDRFQRFFPGEKLRFGNKNIGFVLEASPEGGAKPAAK